MNNTPKLPRGLILFDLLSIALILIGMFELQGTMQIVPEWLKFPYYSYVLLAAGLVSNLLLVAYKMRHRMRSNSSNRTSDNAQH